MALRQAGGVNDQQRRLRRRFPLSKSARSAGRAVSAVVWRVWAFFVMAKRNESRTRHDPSRATPEPSMAPDPAGLKQSGGHFNAGRKDLRALQLCRRERSRGDGNRRRLQGGRRGAVGAFHTGRAAFLVVWPPAVAGPEMLRTLAAQGERFMDADELAAVLGKKPTGGHWNSGIAVLRNNGLIETDAPRYRTATLFRE
jgi:hypothetical protein